MEQPGLSALALLSEDHRAISRLFARFEALRAADANAAVSRRLAHDICQRLIVHAVVEEELFYPAAFDALEDEQVIASAASDHRELHALIRQIERAGIPDADLDTGMARLARLVAEHVQQEEGALFTRLAFTSLDVEGLGRRMLARRDELMGEPADPSWAAGRRLQLKKR